MSLSVDVGTAQAWRVGVTSRHRYTRRTYSISVSVSVVVDVSQFSFVEAPQSSQQLRTVARLVLITVARPQLR